MIIIKNLELKKTYRIEWLRYITGVDLSNHCMKSFLGTNDPQIKGYQRNYYNIKLREGYQYYYFCAVDQDWIWKNNIHITFREKAGSKIIIDNELVSCEIENAESIPIDSSAIDWSLPQSQNKKFSNCRNWMFANLLKQDFDQQRLIFGN